jgi:hypothetical protein
MTRALASILFVIGAAGCGLVPSQASCDGRPNEPACTDLLTNKNNQARPTLVALCVGTYSDSLCNHTGALGGCECDSCENGKGIEWLFPSPDAGLTTAADVMKACGSRTFVSP